MKKTGSDKKFFSSVSVRLAARFTILVTVSVLVLSIAFGVVLGAQVRAEKDDELQKCAQLIENALKEEEEKGVPANFSFLPYYITYTVWKSGNADGSGKGNAGLASDSVSSDGYGENRPQIISTNDPFLPLLKETGKKSRTFVSKDYFIDGDLNILYFAEEISLSEEIIMIETAVNMDTDSTAQLNRKIPKVALIAFFPILAVSFLVSLFMTRHTMKPVIKMTNAAKEISSENLESRLPVSTHNDELDELAVTFNRLFGQLKNDFDRERQFTSDVSHELKTPVAVILGQANLLRRWGKDDPAQLEKSLGTIISESKSMQAIIENLLQMSRLESGRVKPELSAVDVKSLFSRIKEETLSICPEAGFSIESEDNISVSADEELLHQVFTVIVSNSIKYTGAVTEEDGSKRVPVLKAKCRTEEDRAVIEIEDNGKGFEPETIDKVFERFFRQDSSHTRTAGGSGLGLSIARTIIQAMDGKISAYNAAGGGAGIRITLKTA